MVRISTNEYSLYAICGKRKRDCPAYCLCPLHARVSPAGADFSSIPHEWSESRSGSMQTAAPKLLTCIVKSTGRLRQWAFAPVAYGNCSMREEDKTPFRKSFLRSHFLLSLSRNSHNSTFYTTKWLITAFTKVRYWSIFSAIQTRFIPPQSISSRSSLLILYPQLRLSP
jgi:hypothetical protein